jgi:hypothetical protein
MSTASLAAGAKPLDGSRELKIEDPRDKLVNRSGWERPVEPAVKPAGSAVLRNPEPVDSELVRAAVRAESLDQLKAQLTQRGMTDYQAEKWGDGMRVVCTVPRKNDPTRSRGHEAYAATENEAVKAIIAKIDADP